MPARTQSSKIISDERSSTVAELLDQFFDLVEEYSTLEKGGYSFGSNKYDAILTAKLTKYAKQHSISIEVFTAALTDFYKLFSERYSLPEPPELMLDQKILTLPMQSDRMLSSAVDALSRTADVAEKAVSERRKLLGIMAKTQKNIDRTQLETSLGLKRLVAGH